MRVIYPEEKRIQDFDPAIGQHHLTAVSLLATLQLLSKVPPGPTRWQNGEQKNLWCGLRLEATPVNHGPILLPLFLPSFLHISGF